MNEQLYERLIGAARARQFVFYGVLADELGLDITNPDHGDELLAQLAEISRHEVANQRPMLSSIVVREIDHLPASDFYELGRLLDQVAEGENETDFAVRQIKMTHEYWSELEPFGEGGEEAV